MFFQPADLLKIFLAILLGGLVGGEREAREKSAGFRTIILICLGATLFTLLSLSLAKTDDPTRIAANIVVGIGFLGAGAIIRDNHHISGLTTASTIWLAAAIGMAIGAGNYLLAIFVTLFALIVLWVFPTFENKINNLHHTITYTVVCLPDLTTYKQLEAIFTQHGLKLHSKKRTKEEGKISITWEAFGNPRAHDSVVELLQQDERVLQLTY